SNYDRRLYSVAAGLADLRRIEHVVISADVGWRKPAAEFFAALCRKLGRRPDEILFVGDDPTNDYAGAQAAGLRAVLYDPRNRHPDCPARIETLTELLTGE